MGSALPIRPSPGPVSPNESSLVQTSPTPPPTIDEGFSGPEFIIQQKPRAFNPLPAFE